MVKQNRNNDKKQKNLKRTPKKNVTGVPAAAPPGAEMQLRCDRWGRKWDTGRGETGENDSGKYGTAGPLPLGRTQPQQAPSFVEGRRENGRGRARAAGRQIQW